MSYRYSKSHIDDIQSNGCTEHEISILCDIQCSLMKQLTALQAHSASFHLNKNAWAIQHQVTGFTLQLTHALPDCTTVWLGTFTHPSKQATIIGTVEKL